MKKHRKLFSIASALLLALAALPSTALAGRSGERGTGRRAHRPPPSFIPLRCGQVRKTA